MHTGSDTAFFGWRGIPTTIFRPGEVTKAHAPDECAAECDVVESAKVVALALATLVVGDG